MTAFRNPLSRASASVLMVGSALFACPANVADASSTQDLSPGTVINSANVDSLKMWTFEDRSLEDLLIERLEWQIRNHNLQVRLKQSEVLSTDPRLVQKTQQYAGTASVDPETLMMTGYHAGAPFSAIDAQDPLAAMKIIYNAVYAWPHGDNFSGPFAFVFIDGDGGVERVQSWDIKRYYMTGQITKDTPIEGDGSIFHKTLLYAQFPQDVKGLGSFTIRYNDGRLDNVWAYIRAVRRVRRLSGGAWMDPIGGTDEFQDDIVIFNAHPSWYTGYKLLGKRTVLLVVNSDSTLENGGAWIKGAKTRAEEFPRIDLLNKPYWNVKDRWAPQEVYVVEALPPVEHPYGKKVIYIDAKHWILYAGEAYDRKGEF